MTSRIFPLLALLSALAASACVDDRASLEAYGICTMPTSCAFSGGCAGYNLGSIEFATDFAALSTPAERLQIPVELRNQNPNNKDSTTNRVNSNDAHVTGYRLEYTSGGPPNRTLAVSNQTIPAGGPGIVWVYALTGGDPPGFYTVNVTFLGYYDNGGSFETPPYPIALEVYPGAVSYGCTGVNVDVCPGTFAQNLRACGTT